MAIVYKTINQINRKIYIGQSIYDDPLYLGSGLKLQKVIKKYRKDNFSKEILWTCLKDQFKTLIQNYQNKMFNRQKESWNRDKSGNKNPNSKKYKFIHDNGNQIEFDGNFEKDCKKYTGYSVDVMRLLVKVHQLEYKGWRFINE